MVRGRTGREKGERLCEEMAHGEGTRRVWEQGSIEGVR